MRCRGHKVVVADRILKEGVNVVLDLNYPLPFSDHVFDVVVSLAVLEHLDNWKVAIKEFKRVGKSVIITTPTRLAKPVLEFLAALKLVNPYHIKDHKYYLKTSDFTELGYDTKTFLLGFNRVAIWGISIDA